MKRVLLAGGGSGGHVTPLKAIISSLEKATAQPLDITVVTDRGFYAETKKIFADNPDVTLRKIFSGKYRRYKSKSFAWHVMHMPTLLKNLRDIFLLGIGVLQSLWQFLVRRPDVVFCKGGFVCVPIGIAAKLYGIPLVIHDSDTRPGLTNKILARWAAAIGTGMPASFYPYPKERVIHTGIPVSAEFKPVTRQKQLEYKKSLQIKPEGPVLLVTGGGNGAVSLNKQVAAAAPRLLESGFTVVHLAGRGKVRALKRSREALPEELRQQWQIEEFAPMAPRLLAADIIICRTSASTLQECANAQKPVVGIASPHLDDQKMNAEFFASKKAIVSLDETQLSDDGTDLTNEIMRIHADAKLADALAKSLHSEFAQPHAADTIARMLLKEDTSS